MDTISYCRTSLSGLQASIASRIFLEGIGFKRVYYLTGIIAGLLSSCLNIMVASILTMMHAGPFSGYWNP